jgi:eukaryotic-like serine/threonine-protein kinase
VTTPPESLSSKDRSPLTPNTWRNVKNVFHQALERPTHERQRFVEERCADDPTLREEVLTLLAANPSESSFLDVPFVENAGLLAPKQAPMDDHLFATVASALADGYRLERALPNGGMARVFLARELDPERLVVIKILNPERANTNSTDRFEREVRVAARLSHPNIVPLLNRDQINGLPYYTMPFIQGGSLRAREASGPIPLRDALRILREIASALAYAHREGVVHRDIKPDNVLFSSGSAMVSDFGIAKPTVGFRPVPGSEASEPAATPLTREGHSIGTPGYMSPEQVAGDAALDPRSDIYSFGVLAYELLAGTHPFEQSDDPRTAHGGHAPRSIAEVCPQLPTQIGSIVMRCLRRPRHDRFADGTELLAEIERAELGSSTGANILVGSLLLSDTDAPIARWDAASPSVAVLPFENLSGDPENEYFSDGITAEVISALTRVRGLRVAAATSSFALKRQSIDLRMIAERLGVASVIEGTVRRWGDRVRITVQLVSADGLTIPWSDRYDRELADIFAAQDEIAGAIVDAIRRNLTIGAAPHAITPSERRHRGTVNSDAFELYLRGRQLVERRDEGMREGMNCFERAIHLDPGFAAAHAGLAYGFALFGFYHAMHGYEAFPHARDAADRALAIDQTEALALVMRAHAALWYEWDVTGAKRLAQQALDCAPSLYLAHDCLGFVLAAQGRFDESIAAMQYARELDPLADFATYDLGWVMIMARRWEEGLVELRKAVARHPESSEMRRVYAYCLFHSGHHREALAEFRRLRELSPTHSWGPANLAQALAACGEFDEARSLVRTIEARATTDPMPLTGLAIAHHWLGDDEAALAWLERAVEKRDYWLIMLPFDPSIERLRADPRFHAVMRRVGADNEIASP